MSGSTRDILIEAAKTMLTEATNEGRDVVQRAARANGALARGDHSEAMDAIRDIDKQIDALRSSMNTATVLLGRAFGDVR